MSLGDPYAQKTLRNWGGHQIGKAASGQSIIDVSYHALVLDSIWIRTESERVRLLPASVLFLKVRSRNESIVCSYLSYKHKPVTAIHVHR